MTAPFFIPGDRAVCMTSFFGTPARGTIWIVAGSRIEDGHETLTFRESEREFDAWAFRKADERDGPEFASAFRWAA